MKIASNTNHKGRYLLLTHSLAEVALTLENLANSIDRLRALSLIERKMCLLPPLLASLKLAGQLLMNAGKNS
jgi:hypothetical protein